MALWTPAHRILTLPGSPRRRMPMRPDARWLATTRLSGAPLDANEIDYDELTVVRTWRAWDEREAGAVRYFMYELAQRNPGEAYPQRYFKAVRFLRLTRVPRWLRQQGSGTGRAGNSQMSYVLAALREQGVLFTQLVAKTSEIPLVYAYGVQAVGATPEEAQSMADEAYFTLAALLDGTFQQIEYAPIKMEEAEALARYQSTWQNIAVARGRPMPSSDYVGAASILDGNRTDMEQTHNQMEAFIRGLSESERGFMLSLVTVPLAIADMSVALTNISNRLTELRSETYGAKSFTAGVALPLSVGTSAGLSHGDTHSSTAAHSDGVSESHSISDGVTHSASHSSSDSISHSQSQSDSHGSSMSVGDSHSHTQGTSLSQSAGSSHTASAGHGQSLSDSVSQSQSAGISEGRTLTAGVSAGTNSALSSSNATGASLTQTDGFSQSHGTSTSHAIGTSSSANDTSSTGSSASSGSNLSGTPFGLGGGATSTNGTSDTTSSSHGTGVSSTLTGGNSNTSGVSSSLAQGLSQTQTVGTSQGTSQSQSLSDSSSLSATTSQTLGSGRTLGSNISESLSQGTTLSRGIGTSDSMATGTSRSLGESLTRATSVGETRALASSQGTSVGQTQTAGVSQGTSQSQSISDAYAVAMSRTASSTGSIGVVPSFGISKSTQTVDVAKREVGDVLESIMKRYQDGTEGGAYLYQMFLLTEDRETLMAGSALLKSAFWAPGTPDQRIGQPFHVLTEFEALDREAEEGRLIEHARSFSSYRRREPVAEIIEPFMYSSYATVSELSAFCRPPVAEGPGLLAVHDSAPVLAMPADRQHRELTLGRLFNGERARVSQVRYGVNADELTHVLVSGTTGSGKTTTLNTLLAELTKASRVINDPVLPGNVPTPSRTVYPSILALDWMENMRHLGSLVEPVSIDPVTGEKKGRFQFYSIRNPELGAFAWNPLAIPDNRMNPSEWINTMADNMVASWGLGLFARSLIAEYIDRLYTFDRLEPQVLRPEKTDELGNITRPAIMLDPIDRASLPPEALAWDPVQNKEVANVHTYPELSRLVGMEHLAVLVLAEVEAAATVEGGRQGTSVRDRLQSLWRRVQPFISGGSFSQTALYDPDLRTRRCLTVDDIVNPDLGLITVIETDGLDLANRRFILGTLLLSVYTVGLMRGEGAYNQQGEGVGLFLVLEEAHELYGSGGDEEDQFSVSTRTALFESMHRRLRSTGARLINVVQNPGDIPEAITSNINTVFIHRAYADADRKRIFSLLNWSNMVGQQLREYRWLGEMPVGYCIARLHARDSYLESAPVQLVVEPAAMGKVTNELLKSWARAR